MKKIFLPSLLILFFACVFTHHAEAQKSSDDFNYIDDNRTVDPTQNKDWKEGDYPYPSRPRDMWELGLNLGHSIMSGDVEPVFPSGLAFGLSLRKAVNYTFSVRASVNRYSLRGLDARPMGVSTILAEKTIRQNNLASRLDGVKAIHRNYHTTIWGGGLEGVLNLGNILFHQHAPKWNVNLSGGIAFQVPDTKVNLFDGNSNYNWASATQGKDLTKKADRKEIRKRLKDMLDDSWETKGGVENTILSLSDEKKVYPMAIGSVEIVRKLSDRFNLGIRHEINFADNDLLDGFEYRSSVDRSNNNDVFHYTALTLGVNLGSFNKRTEPLYWLNPLGPAMLDLADVKSRPWLDLTDSDGDGVIDLLDQEPDTPEGAPVDVRGIALDSDGDGVPDYRDLEPFSPPGFDVDKDGVAIIPDKYLTESEVNDLINNKMSNLRMDWWLPMIHFDLDKYYVRPEYYSQLMHVATVMNDHPNLKIVVKGYADNRNDDQYNLVLSYNRAEAAVEHLVDRYDIPRERLIIQYSGEANPLVPNLPDNHNISKREEMQQFMNRRVEFFVAKSGDTEMNRPSGPDAGKGTPGSSRTGTKYSGNKNSGY